MNIYYIPYMIIIQYYEAIPTFTHQFLELSMCTTSLMEDLWKRCSFVFSCRLQFYPSNKQNWKKKENKRKTVIIPARTNYQRKLSQGLFCLQGVTSILPVIQRSGSNFSYGSVIQSLFKHHRVDGKNRLGIN